jgi:hypothetical protein
MARIIGKYIKGSAGKFVYKVIDGVQILQSAPGKGGVKQTKATKKAANIFGRSSALACTFRSGLKPVFNSFYDGKMVSRLTGEVSALVRQCYQATTQTFIFNTDSFKSLAGFNFNLASPLQRSLWLPVESKIAGNVLTITLPELKVKEDLKFPKVSNLCRIIICLKIFNLEKGLELKMQEIRRLEVKSDQVLVERQDFEFQIPEGCLCLAGIGLHYYTMSDGIAYSNNNKTFNPSGICAAHFNPGTFKDDEPLKWNFKGRAALK